MSNYGPISVSTMDGQCSIYVDGIPVASFEAEKFKQCPDLIRPVLGEFGIAKIDIPLGFYLFNGSPIYIFRKCPCRFASSDSTYSYQYYDMSAGDVCDMNTHVNSFIDVDHSIKSLLKIDSEEHLQSLLRAPRLKLEIMERRKKSIEKMIDTIEKAEKERIQ